MSLALTQSTGGGFLLPEWMSCELNSVRWGRHVHPVSGGQFLTGGLGEQAKRNFGEWETRKCFACKASRMRRPNESPHCSHRRLYKEYTSYTTIHPPSIQFDQHETSRAIRIGGGCN